MLHYLLQILIFQSLFLLVYDVFHKKDTFFNWNRLYLIVTPFLSLILPFIELDFLTSSSTEIVVTNIERSIIVPTEKIIFNTNVTRTDAGTNGIQINWWIVTYLAGVLLSFINLLLKFHKLHILRNVSHISKSFNQKIVILPNSMHAFSFWNTIFIGDSLTEEEQQHIISHELVHVNHKHTIDQIGIELLKILLWWNPLVYIYQARITLLHEYIADAITIHKVNQKNYIEQLLNSAFQTEKITFINQFFNQSLIKKRIFMLQKSQSKSIAKFKYLLLIPVLTGILTYTSCKDGSSINESNEPKTTPVTEVSSNNDKKAVSNQPACLNKGSKYDYKLDNYLKIENGKNADIIAKLILLETNEVTRTVLIYKNQKRYVRNIPEGIYRIDVTYGEDYMEKETDGVCNGSFQKEILFETGEDILDFTTIITDQGKNVPSYSMTLDLLPEELRKNHNHTDEVPVTEQESTRKKAMDMAQKMAKNKTGKKDDISIPISISKEKVELNCANNASKYDTNLNNYLKISNGKNSEIIVDIVNLETLESVRTIHLPKDTQHYVRNIPEATYNLEIVYGTDLRKTSANGNCKLSFNNKLAKESGKDKLDFHVARTSTGTNVPSYSITLDVSYLIK
ncbi:M56 family metallopeptidase [uncultured Aquimarina sp.]|uniref:M56 family metallopeptidase n=1 Tax=uncultured Aquimarina sp. TaxID=575652 RepID=UPI00260D260E|nr:M56 family metallopeptidase [uncultured Aquimarina sp.]